MEVKEHSIYIHARRGQQLLDVSVLHATQITCHKTLQYAKLMQYSYCLMICHWTGMTINDNTMQIASSIELKHSKQLTQHRKSQIFN